MHAVFKAALAEADYQRREYVRVKEGKRHKTSSALQLVCASPDFAWDRGTTMLPGKQLI